MPPDMPHAHAAHAHRSPAMRIVGARIVTRDAVLEDACLLVEDGIIRSLDAGACAAEEIDFGGDLLIPGLIDIHTDNLERHYMPRPGALWDAVGAAIAHDGQLATAGITTVLDSLSLHGNVDGLARDAHLSDMIAGLDDARCHGLLRIDHQLHVRCEVSDPHVLTKLEPLRAHPALRMMSVMDHTPGQGQYHDLEKMRARWRDQGKSDEDIETMLERMHAMRDADGALDRRRAVADAARHCGVSLASHDDRLVEDVSLAAQLGCAIAEFPVSMEAARAAREHGMHNVMGAPNFVRGRSHSGNLSAQALAEAGLMDAICSDYVPMSMLRTVFMLTEAPFCWSLPDAVAQATAAPARMSKLDDRGEIAVGLRADILRIRQDPGRWPAVRGVWCAGVRGA
jgi:alpha-D-ribose 1-methylphosphonate 5-triphosphate diphosphatase